MRHRAFWTLCLGGLLGLGLALALARGSAAAPPNFQTETLILGLNEPTGLTFTPDGRLLVLERYGTIRLVLPGETQPAATPFLQLSNVNTDQGERGLVGLALAPDFSQTGNYYVFYTANTPLRDRVARFTASGNTTVPGSEVIIWQDSAEAGLWHHGGNLAFGPDGKLYVAVGDNFDTNYGAGHVSQRLDSYRGKILRLNADGSAPADNPFYDGAGPQLDAIWAMGLRNPFRFSFDPPTGTLWIGDVGGNNTDSVEELDRGTAGANYGWPICEGPCATPGMTSPAYSYNHNSRDASITGGFVYRGTQFPAEYQGSYFYGDYAQNWIRRLTFDAGGGVANSLAFEPANGALDGPSGDIVDLKPGPDGALYYVDIGPLDAAQAGTVRRIRYLSANQPPVIGTAAGAPLSGPGPTLTVTFTAAASDPESDALTYQWSFGDAASAAGPDAVHLYAQPGRYTARLAVSDGTSTVYSDPLVISVGSPPQAAITAPVDGSLFRAGDVITYTGAATDTDGSLSAANFSWSIVFHHDDHLHPAAGPVTNVITSTFSIPINGHDFSGQTAFEIILTVTDADGLPARASVLIVPEIVTVTLASDPPGLGLNFDQATGVTAPFTRTTLINFQHTLDAPASQVLAGVTYNFQAWSDGGARTHVLTVPPAGAAIIAYYQAAPATATATPSATPSATATLPPASATPPAPLAVYLPLVLR
ncbi:MAG: PQQ-dependent sugar dehydrogenase [Anaerolineales bacterium]|nr:PQQ-dependent sugar dehydrogenase [Anaerolineales bacterium]